MHRKIEACRICGNTKLTEALDLGIHALTGVFPRSGSHCVTTGPLKLVKCTGDAADTCGLLQLQHTYDMGELYGDNYGYRSGLNASMVSHLRGKVHRILERISLPRGALIIDIGSNDSTTLQAYPEGEYIRVGVDPTAEKFRQFYPRTVALVPEFFSAEAVRRHCGDRKATVITSFSMFYDLEDPLAFMKQVRELLDDQGVWVFEQSYMPTMLQKCSYDTVCQEHLEYYALKQLKWMADRCDLKLVEIEFNDVNGGSFSVTAATQSSPYKESAQVAAILQIETLLGLDTPQPYERFARRIADHKAALREFLERAAQSGKSVGALGASTKGNVLLQYCNVTDAEISQIGDVNPEKFGRFTPGSRIPIVSEEEALGARPDFLLILPWHFRSFFLTRPGLSGRNLVFPLPELEVVRCPG